MRHFKCRTDKNKNYAFVSAHDPFEPIYFWQFVHAVCTLATVAYDRTRRQTAHKANRTADGNGLLASALHDLFTEHMKIDIVPTSYGKSKIWDYIYMYIYIYRTIHNVCNI